MGSCWFLAGVLLFTPYEAVLEGVIAGVMVTAVLVGFLMHPRREVLYVRTTLPVIDPDRNKFLEPVQPSGVALHL